MTQQQKKILQSLTAAYPTVKFELHGDGCHFEIIAVGELFSGLKKLQRQQLLNKVLTPFITQGVIHAVNYTISTPEEVLANG